jgi:hypothetical protein
MGDFLLLIAIFAVAIAQEMAIRKRTLKGGICRKNGHLIILRTLNPINVIQDKIYAGLVNKNERVSSNL